MAPASRSAPVLVAAFLLLAACSGSDGGTSAALTCDLAHTSSTLTLAPLQGARVADSACVRLEGEAGARYLVVPQYATQGSAPRQTAFFVGNEIAGTGTLAALAARARMDARLQPRGRASRSAQQRLDARLRAIEHELAPEGARLAQQRASDPAFRASIAAATRGPAAAFAAMRTFKTLGNVSGTSFKTVTAALKYTGQNIVIYADTATPSGGFTDTELQQFGDLFDQTLFPIDTNAFGAVSDIDANAKVIVLMTPRVNALVTATECNAGGFITGYFLGTDLASSDTSQSNRGEVFYTLTPDAAGANSCSHSVEEVERLVPETFIHELQHMISFNQHVLVRHGSDEDVWLNEGLSLMAEQLGSLHYERKYPAPAGRTNPDQLFPDSSQGFIVADVEYAYNYLAGAPDTSVTTFASSGALGERGGAFLFLNYVADQKGWLASAAAERGFRALEETTRTGIDNVAHAVGAPFPSTFGDFGIATYTDSLPGVARGAIPARYRFQTRNWRQLFQRLYDTGTPDVIIPFPIQPATLPAVGGDSASMVQGTSDYFLLTFPAGTTTSALHLVRPTRRALDAALAPQLNVFRLPLP